MQSGKTRVLFLLRKLDLNDGITSYCQTLASGLVSAGVPVDLALGAVHFDPNERHRWESLEKVLTSWRVLPKLRTVPDPLAMVSLWRLMRARGTSVINIHGLGMLPWGKLLSVVTRRPFVATYHPSVHGQPEALATLSTRPLTRAQKAVLRVCRPSRLVVLSDESAQYLKRECPAVADRIVKVNGAVRDSYFRPPTGGERARARVRYGLNDTDVVVLHVGRMSWNKGHDLLIDAVRDVRQARPDLRLRCLFVGSGDQADSIRARGLQSNEDEDSFNFLGFVENLREVLWAADIFALPSRLEGFAIAAVEAMFTGLVVVRTPSGGASDQIIDGRTGLIVPFDDSPALAQALSELSDDQTRAGMRAESLAHAQEHFSEARMASRIISLYSEVTNGFARGRRDRRHSDIMG